MKLFASVLWLGTALQASTASTQALLYTSESSSPLSNGGPPSISPVTARLLLAQRLGLSQFHSLEDAGKSTLDVLNHFGGKQPQIFEDEEWRRGAAKLLLVIEGVSNPEDIVDSPMSPAMTIDDPPTAFENEELVLDLLEQDINLRGQKSKSGSLKFGSGSFIRGGLSASRVSSDYFRQLKGVFDSTEPRLSEYRRLYETAGLRSLEHTTILHVTTLQARFLYSSQELKYRLSNTMQDIKPTDNKRYQAAISDLKALINYTHKPNSPISSTLILIPPTPKNRKRSTSPYGTYNKLLSSRQQQPEEPLTTPSSNRPSAPEISLLQTTTSPLPHGILPACHSTLEAAIAATNNCSNHGTAYKKSSGETDCYACKCSKTVLTDDEGGTKTTYWGGPACQKKDISVPFFLLAGLSIALVGAATWGVGLLASIGQEELPSVIGAGVAGPRAQK